MLSKKTRYAMLSTIMLAREYGHGPVAISTIAEQEHIPQRFLEGILLQLKKQGILLSTRGKTGGYMLARAPEAITIDEVIKTFDPNLFLHCLCQNRKRKCDFCRDMEQCRLRSTFLQAYQATTSIFQNTTLADLAEGPLPAF